MANFAPVVFSQTASDVTSDLRRRILSLELPPGSLISRTGLQAYYALSSTPVRDALIRLQEEGLVEIYPQARTLVSRIDLKQAREAHFLRSALERSIARQLASKSDTALISQLEHIIGLQEQQMRRQDYKSFSDLDLAFHKALFEASDHLSLFEVVRRESVHIDRLRAFHLPLGDKAARILADHRTILAGLVSGDPDRMEAAVEEHLSQSIGAAEEISKMQPDYFKP